MWRGFVRKLRQGGVSHFGCSTQMHATTKRRLPSCQDDTHKSEVSTDARAVARRNSAKRERLGGAFVFDKMTEFCRTSAKVDHLWMM